MLRKAVGSSSEKRLERLSETLPNAIGGSVSWE